VRGLIKTDFPAAKGADRCLCSPVFFFDRGAVYAFSLQRLHKRRPVVAHQVEDRAKKLPSAVKLTPLAVRGVYPDFGGRQRENEPAAAGVHCRKSENIAEDSAVGFGVVAVEEHVSADNSRGLSGKFIKEGCFSGGSLRRAAGGRLSPRGPGRP
jgi:hypothetical protein